jgi:hypothetical protein
MVEFYHLLHWIVPFTMHLNNNKKNPKNIPFHNLVLYNWCPEPTFLTHRFQNYSAFPCQFIFPLLFRYHGWWYPSLPTSRIYQRMSRWIGSATDLQCLATNLQYVCGPETHRLHRGQSLQIKIVLLPRIVASMTVTIQNIPSEKSMTINLGATTSTRSGLLWTGPTRWPGPFWPGPPRWPRSFVHDWREGQDDHWPLDDDFHANHWVERNIHTRALCLNFPRFDGDNPSSWT